MHYFDLFFFPSIVQQMRQTPDFAFPLKPYAIKEMGIIHTCTYLLFRDMQSDCTTDTFVLTVTSDYSLIRISFSN